MRLRRQIDGAPGEIALAVLSALAPALTEAVPSMGVIRLDPSGDAKPAPVAKGAGWRAKVPHGHVGFSLLGDGFTVWPGRVTAAWARSAQSTLSGTLDVRIDLAQGSFFKESEPGRLGLFVGGPIERALLGAQAFLTGVRSIHASASDGAWTIPLSASCVGQRECVSDRGDPSMAAMVALNWPRTNCFLEVTGLHCPAATAGLVLRFEFMPGFIDVVEHVKAHLRMNCAPVSNRYAGAPFSIDMSSITSPTLTLPRPNVAASAWDVLTVRVVKLLRDGAELELPHLQDAPTAQAFWTTSRRWRATEREGVAGLCVQLLDSHQRPALPQGAATVVVHADLTDCTLAEHVAAGDLLAGDSPSGYRTQMESPPTAYVPAPDAACDGSAALVSALTWRASSADGEGELVAKLRGFLLCHLRLPNPATAATIEALESVRRQAVAVPWRGPERQRGVSLAWRQELRYRSGTLPLPHYFMSRLIARILRAQGAAGEPAGQVVHCCPLAGDVDVR
ncbi:type VI secretion system baseplate subunit TssF [Piscinibacter sp.]|uniref:type VI secretion system baseplate subunit TssF n=1 Tax=Piscinibacter sp. TaxID=1903157 RepID=UPI002CE23083|nr:type VI secretion system baseplate subunit TssF [Albitalea sp.]HUG22183.1 type VI secretion system baseplate subunit TssF [Albitalea sp.]